MYRKVCLALSGDKSPKRRLAPNGDFPFALVNKALSTYISYYF